MIFMIDEQFNHKRKRKIKDVGANIKLMKHILVALDCNICYIFNFILLEIL